MSFELPRSRPEFSHPRSAADSAVPPTGLQPEQLSTARQRVGRSEREPRTATLHPAIRQMAEQTRVAVTQHTADATEREISVPTDLPQEAAHNQQNEAQPTGVVLSETVVADQAPSEDPMAGTPEQLPVATQETGDPPQSAAEQTYASEEDSAPEKTVVQPAVVAAEPIPVADIKYLPKVSLVGKHTGPKLERAVEDVCRAARPDTIAREIDHEAYKETFKAVQEVICGLAAERGCSVIDRMYAYPGESNLHVYTPGEFRQLADDYGVEDRERHTSGIRGFISREGMEMHIMRGSDAARDARVMQHEGLHMAGHLEVELEEMQMDDGQISLSPHAHTDGYLDLQTGAHRWLHEVTTEATNIDGVRNHWPYHPTLQKHASKPVRKFGYPGGLLLFDGLLKASFDSPVKRRDMVTELGGGAMTGDMGPRDVFGRAVGSAVMGRLATLNPADYYRQFQLARKLGLKQTAAQFKARNYRGATLMPEI